MMRLLNAALVAYSYCIKSPLYCLRAQTLSSYMPSQRHHPLRSDVDVGISLRAHQLSGVGGAYLEEAHFDCIQNPHNARMS